MNRGASLRAPNLSFMLCLVFRPLRIVIYMYWDDHNPPHYHAVYGEYEAWMMIESGTPGTLRERLMRG